MVQPLVEPRRTVSIPAGLAEVLRAAAGWTNDGNAYLIDGSCSSPQGRRAEPDED